MSIKNVCASKKQGAAGRVGVGREGEGRQTWVVKAEFDKRKG